jgi:ABC-type polysaccharide/polyol phosphate export permease
MLSGMSPSHSRAAAPELRLSAQPESRRSWLRELWAHRVVLGMLARADFQARYKRTSFGVAWAVVVPMIQAVVIVVVFSRLIKLPTTRDFGAYVLGGTLSWNYFSSSVGASSSAIVDGAGLTDKVWFPRALLSGIAPLSNLPGLVAAVILLAVALPFLGSSISFSLLQGR